jgi:voltage-gated potassium channel
MAWLRLHRYLILIAALGFTLLVQSTGQGFTGGRIVSDLLASVILLAVLLVVFERHRDRIAAVSVVAVGIASRWALHLFPGDEFRMPLTVLHYVLLIAFFGYAVALILGNIFRKNTVTADDILGAVCGYLIAGAAWSSLYALTDSLVAGSFTIAPGLDARLSDWPGRTALFNYFSIVTLTTMGYGDITPNRAPATVFAMFEAVFGQFYIAVVVAQLVSARLVSGGRERPDGGG